MPNFQLLVQTAPDRPARWVQMVADSIEAAEQDLFRERKAVLAFRSTDRTIVPLRFSKRDQPQFFTELADAVYMESPLTETLGEFAESMGSKRSQAVCRHLREALLGGEKLMDAMRGLPRAFTPTQIGLVEAFDKVGKPHEGLRRCYELLDRADRVWRAARGAMIYPAIVLLLGIVFVIFIGRSALPTLRGAYTTGAPPPALFETICQVADLTLNNGLFMVGLLGVGLPVAVVLGHRAVRAPLAHRLLLRVPVVGKFIKTYVAANFLRTYTALTESELPEPEKMKMCVGLTSLRPYQEAFAQARLEAQAGAFPHAALARYEPLFGKRMMGVIRRGAISGKLASVLRAYLVPVERDLDDAVAAFGKLVTPLALLLVLPPLLVMVVGVFSGIMGLISVY